MKRNSFLLSLIFAVSLIGVSAPLAVAQSVQQQTASARNLFVDGRSLFDDGKYSDAEKKFREALTRYPKAEQSDRTSYYLITTLVKLGRAQDARKEIDSFRKNYPQSSWKQDVDEKSVALGGSYAVLDRVSQAVDRVNGNLSAAFYESTAARESLSAVQARDREAAARSAGRGYNVNLLPFNASLQAEVLRQILDKDAERGIENAKEMLKADPSDNAVIANLPVIANSTSAQALPFLLSIVTNTAASPNARSQAIYYMSRRMNEKADEKELVSKALMDLLSKKEAEGSLVSDALGRFNSRDRQAALEQMASGARTDKLDMLEKIFRSSTSSAVRSDVVQAVAKLTDAKSTAFIVDVAQTDKDTNVRRSAVQALAGRKDVDVKVLENILKSLPKTSTSTAVVTPGNFSLITPTVVSPNAPPPPAPRPTPVAPVTPPAPVKQ